MGIDRSALKAEAWAVAGIALPIIITNALLMLLQVRQVQTRALSLMSSP
jgi:hypothetical protein